MEEGLGLAEVEVLFFCAVDEEDEEETEEEGDEDSVADDEVGDEETKEAGDEDSAEEGDEDILSPAAAALEVFLPPYFPPWPREIPPDSDSFEIPPDSRRAAKSEMGIRSTSRTATSRLLLLLLEEEEEEEEVP